MTEQQLQEINCYLREQCGWELEVGISPHDTSEFFRVYRLQKNATKAQGSGLGLAICKIVDGDVSAEVIATDYEGMVREGEILAALHPQISAYYNFHAR